MNDDLQQLNRDYVRSVQDSDVRWFEEHLSQDFLNTNPDGLLVGRATWNMGDFAIIHA